MKVFWILLKVFFSITVLLFLFIVMQYDQCFLIRPYCIFDYQMLGDQIAATKLLRPIVVDPNVVQYNNLALTQAIYESNLEVAVEVYPHATAVHSIPVLPCALPSSVVAPSAILQKKYICLYKLKWLLEQPKTFKLFLINIKFDISDS